MRVAQIFTAVLALVSILISGQVAQAETVTWSPKTAKFSYSNTRAYYGCEYAQAQVKHYMNLIGARDVEVDCSGGLPDFNSLNLEVNFLAAVVTSDGVDAEWTPVVLKSRESCEFNETIVRNLLKHFATRDNDTQSSCWNSEGSFTYEFETLK
ncbi:MAG: hypothetical protein V4692_14105 [Bdellovibrionota bacterium]